MKVYSRYVFILTLALLFTGCALGTNYSRPAVDVPVAYKADAPWKEVAPQDNADKGHWWEIYKDQVLNELEVQLLEANQEIKVAFARLMQVQTGERFSRASQLPRFDLNGS